MGNYLLIMISTVLVNNVVLVKILGMCPFFGVSKKTDTAIGMGAATMFVITAGSGMSYLVDTYLLAPHDLTYLRTLAFIVVIASIVQFTEMYVRKASPEMFQLLGIYLPLITTNCAVLGIPLLNAQENHNFIESLLYGFGGSLGFAMALTLFASMRERLEGSAIPAPFKGAGIAMVTGSLLSLAFMGFSGLVK